MLVRGNRDPGVLPVTGHWFNRFSLTTVESLSREQSAVLMTIFEAVELNRDVNEYTRVAVIARERENTASEYEHSNV